MTGPQQAPAKPIPDGLDPRTAAAFARFESLVGTLRESCPWDREQTHASLRRHLLEEAHETLEALDARAALADSDADDGLDGHLCEELGDLLYQVFFHARVAAERGSFGAADVADAVHAKLVGRHPHVFADVVAEDSAVVLGNWEKIKAAEKGRSSCMDGISAAQPALLYAHKTLERAASAGLGRAEISGNRPSLHDAARRLTAGSRRAPQTTEPDDALPEARLHGQPRSTSHSSAERYPSESALGDLLLAAVELARSRHLDPEAALRSAVARFAAEVRDAESREAAGSGPF